MIMAWGGYGYGGWAPYVSVAERRRRALKKMEALRKKGVDIQPVHIDGRKIAKSFWGEAWCEHLESFSDFANRLPRGRSYVRNGSVCHLALAHGRVEAKVSGSELYDVKVTIKTLPPNKWNSVKGRCGGQIGSLIELLQGRLSDHVMEIVTHREEGLFPLPGEMSFICSCPDSARMCKHVAAVLYGVGARLDNKPELLFVLRGVDHEELIAADAETAVTAATSRSKAKRLAENELSDVFGIELDANRGNVPVETLPAKKAASSKTPGKRRTVRKVVKKPRKGVAKTQTTGKVAVSGEVVKTTKAAKKMSRVPTKARN
jgi:uncharacterized Zn finger protein